MPNIKILIIKEYEIPSDTYSEIRASDYLGEITQILNLPPGGWTLTSKDTHRGLQLERTLEQNGVLDGHQLYLRRENAATLASTIAGSNRVVKEGIPHAASRRWLFMLIPFLAIVCGVVGFFARNAEVKRLRVELHVATDDRGRYMERFFELAPYWRYLFEIAENETLPKRPRWGIVNWGQGWPSWDGVATKSGETIIVRGKSYTGYDSDSLPGIPSRVLYGDPEGAEIVAQPTGVDQWKSFKVTPKVSGLRELHFLWVEIR